MRRVHRVVVHDGAELRAEQHDVLRVLRIGHALEAVLVHVADAVHVVAAEDLGRPRRVPGQTGAVDERRDERSAQVEGVEGREHEALGLGLADLAQSARDLVERLVPGDLGPTGIDPGPLVGVRAAHRRRDAVGVAQALETGVTLGTGSTVVVRVGRVAEDLVDHTVVGDVGQDSATIETDRAGRPYPAVAVRRARPCSEEIGLHDVPPRHRPVAPPYEDRLPPVTKLVAAPSRCRCRT